MHASGHDRVYSASCSPYCPFKPSPRRSLERLAKIDLLNRTPVTLRKMSAATLRSSRPFWRSVIPRTADAAIVKHCKAVLLPRKATLKSLEETLTLLS